ncbi:hypothetical protein IPF37_04660 [bacterium]|nr:MAG: hypothetical protein IPF37_04660 [bacterium]
MNKPKFMHSFILATVLFVGVAQGAASNPEEFTDDLFAELAEDDFQVEGTDDNGKFFNNFTHAKQKEAEYFFKELIENLISGDHYDDPGMIFWGDVTVRTDLTWQQIENIIKILKHPQAVQDIIEILKGAQDLDKAKIILKNKKIPSLNPQKKYSIKLFLKSLKTVFETDLSSAKKDSNYKVTNYVPATLLSNLLNNLDTNVQLLKKAKAAKKTAEAELQSLENVIKNTQKAKTNAEDSLKAAEAVEQAEKNLAAAQAGTTPPVIASTPLDQLKNSLMALKTKLVNLAQALNPLQNPGAPQPAAPIVVNNQSVADAETKLAAAKEKLTKLLKIKFNTILETIDDLKTQIQTAKSTLEKENNKLPAAQQKATEAIKHLKETIQLVTEIEFTTPKPASAQENPKIEIPTPDPTPKLEHPTVNRPKKPGRKTPTHQRHAERIKEQKEKITLDAKQHVDEIKQQYKELKAKNHTGTETQEIKTIFKSAREKLATLESNDELEAKKSLARDISMLLVRSNGIFFALKIAEAKNMGAELKERLNAQGKKMKIADLAIIREALDKLNSENLNTQEQARKEIEAIIKKYEPTP